MKNRLTGIMALAMLLIAGLMVPAGAAGAVCPEGDSGKIETTGNPASVTVSAPDGKLISEYCVKAGSEESGAGTEYGILDPPTTEVVISHTSGKDVSHYSLFYVDAPEEPEVDYCDPTQRPAGMSIAQWLPEDFDPADCFTVTPVLACGSFDATVTGPFDGYEMVYLEGANQTTSLDWETLPAVFAEDHNGGSVDITVYLVGPEKDYLVGSGLPNYWDDNGRTVTIDTDCEQPVVEELPITILKEWTGDTDDVAFDIDDVTVTFTLDGGTYEPGDTLDAVVTVDGDDVILPPEPTSFEESVVGLDEVCAYELVSVDLEPQEGGWVVLVTNLVACGETIIEEVIVEVPGETIIEEVIVEVEVLGEVIEAEPEAVEEDVDEEEVEVLGVTATRAVPTSIDTGTGGYLPGSTPSAALLLLLGGLALTGGASASLVRRRG